ncbi:9922_t:CDS:2, partial [Funneliformis geosporum]
MGHNKADCQTLVAQIRKFDLKQVPFDLPYAENYNTPLIWWMTCKSFPNFLETIAIRIFGMTPYSASCERLFSTLGWFMEMQNELHYTGEKMSVKEMIRLLTDSINDELDEDEDENDVDIDLKEDLETVIDVESEDFDLEDLVNE